MGKSPMQKISLSSSALGKSFPSVAGRDPRNCVAAPLVTGIQDACSIVTTFASSGSPPFCQSEKQEISSVQASLLDLQWFLLA